MSKIPQSCGEAWIQYYLADGLADGMLTVDCVTEAQAAFDAGWQAALESVRSYRHVE